MRQFKVYELEGNRRKNALLEACEKTEGFFEITTGLKGKDDIKILYVFHVTVEDRPFTVVIPKVSEKNVNLAWFYFNHHSSYQCRKWFLDTMK